MGAHRTSIIIFLIAALGALASPPIIIPPTSNRNGILFFLLLALGFVGVARIALRVDVRQVVILILIMQWWRSHQHASYLIIYKR